MLSNHTELSDKSVRILADDERPDIADRRIISDAGDAGQPDSYLIEIPMEILDSPEPIKKKKK